MRRLPSVQANPVCGTTLIPQDLVVLEATGPLYLVYRRPPGVEPDLYYVRLQEAQVVQSRDDRRLRARIRGREDRHRADRLELHLFERCPEDLAEPLLGVAQVVEDATPVVGIENHPRQPRVWP